MWPGGLRKTREKTSEWVPVARDLTFRHIRECERRPPCAHVYAQLHCLIFATKLLDNVSRCRFGTYLWQMDGSEATKMIQIHRGARAVSSSRSVWVSALRCALGEYFTRPLFAWQWHPEESTVEEWAETRGGYRLPARSGGGNGPLWICGEEAGSSEEGAKRCCCRNIKQTARSNGELYIRSPVADPRKLWKPEAWSCRGCKMLRERARCKGSSAGLTSTGTPHKKSMSSCLSDSERIRHNFFHVKKSVLKINKIAHLFLNKN